MCAYQAQETVEFAVDRLCRGSWIGAVAQANLKPARIAATGRDGGGAGHASQNDVECKRIGGRARHDGAPRPAHVPRSEH